MTLGSILKKKREEINLNMSNLAEMSGLSQSYISQIENDKRKPTIESLVKIIRSLSANTPTMIKKEKIKEIDFEIPLKEGINVDDFKYNFVLLADFKEFLDEKKLSLILRDLTSTGEVEVYNSVNLTYSIPIDLSYLMNSDYKDIGGILFESTAITKVEFESLKKLLQGFYYSRHNL